jgi:hypothetical protein
MWEYLIILLIILALLYYQDIELFKIHHSPTGYKKVLDMEKYEECLKIDTPENCKKNKDVVKYIPKE